jgi:hypothetical protein
VDLLLTPVPTPPVPEPSSLLVFGSGLLAIGGVLSRKLRRSKA